jgi:hypothetical protein
MATRSRKTVTKTRTRKISPSPIKIISGVEGEDYTLTRLEKKQGEKYIYRVEFENDQGNTCTNYIDDANRHVLYKNVDEQYVLFKLPTSHSKNKTSPSLSNMKKKCAEALLKKRTIANKNVQLTKDAILIQSCAPEIDLSAAQDVLTNLNRELRALCPNLHLKLAPYYDYLEPLKRYGEHGHICIGCQYYNTLILALCSDERCISSIELILQHHGEILINSKTDEDQEGKKYNKLLRAVLSMVAHKIPGIHFFKSTAINPVSTWLLIQYSNARPEEGDPFTEFLDGQNATKERIQEYYARTKNVQIKLIVDLNSENAAHSHKEFKKIIETGEIKC